MVRCGATLVRLAPLPAVQGLKAACLSFLPPELPQATTGTAFAVALAMYAAACSVAFLAFGWFRDAPWARRFYAPKSLARGGQAREGRGKHRRERRRPPRLPPQPVRHLASMPYAAPCSPPCLPPAPPLRTSHGPSTFGGATLSIG